ncbi:MAG: methylmalonic aciduria and homocystinuria type D protein [Synechococcales bacterium]|nr:methylmalonic aciduria and homocystinuria type D protein [Synechococcales bacterium]
MAALADIQYAVHAPNAYICDHHQQLLPEWSRPARSLLVVLQRCPMSPTPPSQAVEASKNLLRDRFLALAETIAQPLMSQGHLVTYFDPKTGLPANSPVGSMAIDDVAVARSLLGYERICNNQCWCLVHPIWGQAVYPSTLVSSASHHHLLEVVQQVLLLHVDAPS